MNDKKTTGEETPPAMRELEREQYDTATTLGDALVEKNIELVRGVEVRLQVRLGECALTVGELFELKENSLLKLDRDVAAPVDLLLDGKLIARGRLIAVDENFGVQITEISK